MLQMHLLAPPRQCRLIGLWLIGHWRIGLWMMVFDVSQGIANMPDPEGRSTQSLSSLVPKPIPLMVFRTKDLKHWELDPLGEPLPISCRGKVEAYVAVVVSERWSHLVGSTMGETQRLFLCFSGPGTRYRVIWECSKIKGCNIAK